MATSPQRVDTRDIAALLAAEDEQGRIDQMAFEAERLVLRNQRVGGVDASALVNELQRSGGLDRYNRDSFLSAIDQRLETPAEKRRFAGALDAANITDSYLERQGERLAEAAVAIRDEAAKRFKEADEALENLRGAGQQRLRGIASDPDSSSSDRAAAGAASVMLGFHQYQIGAARGALSHAARTVGDFVDLAQMADRLSKDPNYRDMIVGMARMYAAEVMDDPKKPLTDAQAAASDAMEKWDKGFREAQARGTESEYLGGTAGAVGVEIVANFVPAGALGKFGKAAKAIDVLVPAEHAVELTRLGEVARVGGPDMHVLGKAGELGRSAREVAGDTARAAESAEALKDIGDALGNMSRGIGRGGSAAAGAEDFARGLTRGARDNGDLEAIVKAAHMTDNVEGLLRSGQLTPKELGEVAKLDKTIFEGPVKFKEALGHSLNGVDLTKISKKQLGDIGEAIQTYDMVEKGYTDIVSIKNKSGHGIDVVGRNPDSQKLEFFEVKTSAQGKAVVQHGGDPEEFIAKRLEKAINGIGQWAEHRTIPELKKIAEAIRDEVIDPATNTFKGEATWVRINVSNEPGSHKLRIDSKESDPWVKPEDRKAELSPGIDAVRNSVDFQTLHKGVAGSGNFNEQQSANVAAALLRECAADPLIQRIDRAGTFTSQTTGEQMAYALYSPHGDRGPHFDVRVNATQAAQEPVEQNLAKVEQINQQQALAQQEEMQRGPDDPGRGGPRMSI
ncbi:XVIPCD domain-containing protein [Lysobacter sp. CA199]|uniref:XVIPCD domain-containing protein n=1 Tax=Lysobacter sp. CA199 TaxID=3455608 RepID=UPI003F8D1EA8